MSPEEVARLQPHERPMMPGSRPRGLSAGDAARLRRVAVLIGLTGGVGSALLGEPPEDAGSARSRCRPGRVAPHRLRDDQRLGEPPGHQVPAAVRAPPVHRVVPRRLSARGHRPPLRRGLHHGDDRARGERRGRRRARLARGLLHDPGLPRPAPAQGPHLRHVAFDGGYGRRPGHLARPARPRRLSSALRARALSRVLLARRRDAAQAAARHPHEGVSEGRLPELRPLGARARAARGRARPRPSGTRSAQRWYSSPPPSCSSMVASDRSSTFGGSAPRRSCASW